MVLRQLHIQKNSIQAAKVAVEFSKKNNKLKIIGGSFEGELIGKRKKLISWQTLPSLDELRSIIIFFNNGTCNKSCNGSSSSRKSNCKGNKCSCKKRIEQG